MITQCKECKLVFEGVGDMVCPECEGEMRVVSKDKQSDINGGMIGGGGIPSVKVVQGHRGGGEIIR